MRGDSIDVYTNVDKGLADAAQSIRITDLGTPQKARQGWRWRLRPWVFGALRQGRGRLRL